MHRLLGLSVGRIVILVFDTDAARPRLNLQEQLKHHTERLRGILKEAYVDDRRSHRRTPL